MIEFHKDPAAALDFKFDWAPATNDNDVGLSDWLSPGETISSYILTVESGLDKDSDELVDGNTAVLVWLSGGEAGRRYSVSCEIITNAVPPRIDKRSMVIRCVNL